MDSDDSVTGPINLGNPGEITVRELADHVIAATGSSAGIEARPLPPTTRCSAARTLRRRNRPSIGRPKSLGNRVCQERSTISGLWRRMLVTRRWPPLAYDHSMVDAARTGTGWWRQTTDRTKPRRATRAVRPADSSTDQLSDRGH